MNNHLDFLADLINNGATADQIVDFFPQFSSDPGYLKVMTDEAQPSDDQVADFLASIKHNWVANSATEGGVTCSKCDAWALWNIPDYGCPGHHPVTAAELEEVSV